MISVKSVINQAYQLAGIVQNDRVADGTQVSIAETKLNQILGQLNIEQLFPFSREVQQFTITSAKPFYTIGDDSESAVADFVAPRPAFVNRIAYSSTNETTPIDVQCIALPDLIIRRRSIYCTGTPYYYALNPKYPSAQIYFDIAPASGYITLIYNAVIPQVSVNDTIAAPHEYSEVLINYLAVELCVSEQMPQDTLNSCVTLRNEVKRRLESSNARNQIPTLESVIGADKRRSNIYTGR